MNLDIKKIKVGSRARKDFGDIILLSESLRRLGLIQPIVVRQIGEDYELIAGERRLRAAIYAGWSTIPVTTKEKCSDEQKLEMELEENIQRKSLMWTEECEIKLQLDEMKRKQFGSGVAAGVHSKEGWTLEKTALALNQSVGTVSQDLKIARALREDKKLAMSLVKYPKAIAYRKLKQIKERERLEKAAPGLVLSVDLRLGDVCDLIKEVPDESIDLWITDPPFGVDQILDAKGVFPGLTDFGDNLNVAEAHILYEKLLPLVFKKLKPSAHFYMFFASEFYPHLVSTLSAVGFHVDPVPLIWDKCLTTTPFRGLSYAQQYEPILFGHKPPREKYLIESASNILQYKPIDSKEKIHVFQKPLSLLSFFINQSSNVGDVVMDTFAGSGSTLKAALDLKRQPLGFELSEHHFRAALESLGKKGKKGKKE